MPPSASIPLPGANSFRNPSDYDHYRVAPYLRNLRQLTIHDEEYHRIAYLLRASLSSLSLKIISIHAINSPQQDGLFESNHIGITTLDSWVNGADLPEQNSVQQIISHGGRFRITDADKGAIFSVGAIGMDETNVAAGPAQYEFVHFRIGVGRSFVVSPAQVGSHGIPSGYDSMIVHKEATVPTEEISPKNVDYTHEYILSDESRIYPDFVVNFVFDVKADRIKEVPMCESCEVARAVVFCMQDNAKLCSTCDRSFHNRPIFERHTRVPLDQMQNSLGSILCSEHSNMPVQFYDPVAHVPVCVHCKMSGSHSTGENANHPLVPIHDAFDASVADLEAEHRIIDERRSTIHEQLHSIRNRMQAVNINHDKCQDQIYEIVQKVVQVLHEETQSKLSALLSDESELTRQLEYYAWAENFLNFQRTSANPVEFLQSFRSHSSLLAQAPSEIVDGAASVRADIRVLGRLDIVVDDTSAAAPAVVPPQQIGFRGYRNPNASAGNGAPMGTAPSQYNQQRGSAPPSVRGNAPPQGMQQQQGPARGVSFGPTTNVAHRSQIQGPGNSLPRFANASRY